MLFKDEKYMYRIKDIKQSYNKTSDERFKIKSPMDVEDLARKFIGNSTREHLIALGLNTKNEVMLVYTVAIGSINACVLHPRKIFQVAILNSCASITLCHNHPSGTSLNIVS